MRSSNLEAEPKSSTSNHFIVKVNSTQEVKISSIKSDYDIFKEEVVCTFLQNNFLVSSLNADDKYDSEFTDTHFVYPSRICRLCARSDPNNIYVPLFDESGKRFPVAKKMITLIGEKNVNRDLLPQQVCMECAKKVETCWMFTCSSIQVYQIFMKALESFSNDYLQAGNSGSTNMFLKINDNFYNLSDFDKKLNFTETHEKHAAPSNNPKAENCPIPQVCYMCLKKFASPMSLQEHKNSSPSCQVQYACTFCDAEVSSFTHLVDHIEQSETCQKLYKQIIDPQYNAPIPLSFEENAVDNKLDSPSKTVTTEETIANSSNELKREDTKKLRETDLCEDIQQDIITFSNESCDNFPEDGSSAGNVCHNPSVDLDSDLINQRVRSRVIMKDEIASIVKQGKQFLNKCKYCSVIFKSNESDNNMKSHILVHLCDYLEGVRLETFDLAQHVILTPCFICPHCSRGKPSIELLNSHLCTCPLFRNKYNLKVRIRRGLTRTEKSSSKCKFCQQEFENKEKLMGHMKQTHSQEMISCSVCGKRFFRKSSLGHHIKRIHGKETKCKRRSNMKAFVSTSILCEFCPKVCKSEAGYRFHVKYGHFGILNQVKSSSKSRESWTKKNFQLEMCDICGRNIPTRPGDSRLEFHKFKHNFSDSKVPCCNRFITTYSAYTRHMQSHKRQWKCTLCTELPVVCESFAALLDHLNSSHNQTDDWCCSICTKKFKTRGKLLSHMKSHSRTIHCKQCNISCSSRSEYQHHQRIFHDKLCLDYNKTTEESMKTVDQNNPVYCCGFKFTKLYNLKVHVAKHQKTVCKKCDVVLNSKLELISHNFSRHRYEGLDCTICHKQLATTSTLKVHMMQHTQDKNIYCGCGLCFYTVQGLKRHHKARKTPCPGKLMEAIPVSSGNPVENLMTDEATVMIEGGDLLHEENIMIDEHLLNEQENEAGDIMMDEDIIYQMNDVPELSEDTAVTLGSAVLKRYDLNATQDENEPLKI